MESRRSSTRARPVTDRRAVTLDLPGARLDADLGVPLDARGIVVFAHGSGSGRHSPRNRHVAELLNTADVPFATLLVDLLTEQEAAFDERTGELRFDIGLLGARVASVVDWIEAMPVTRRLPVGVFGASTGAAAAIVAAAARKGIVEAVVSRGGRPDLAGEALTRILAPTLLIVGGEDQEVLRLNEQARLAIRAPCELKVVPGAGHLFEEPGALGRVEELAERWFSHWLPRGREHPFH